MRKKKKKKELLRLAASQASAQDAAIWRCLRFGWSEWERMKRAKRPMAWGRVGRGRVIGEAR